jgi:transposase
MATQLEEVAMYVHNHEALEALKQGERKERDATRSKRLRIIILALEGWTAPAIAMSVGLSRRDCQEWVRRYNQSGLAGLADRPKGGRDAPLTPQQEQQMHQRLRDGPTPADKVCTLRGADIQAILASEFGILRSLSTVYKLLHRLGYSYLRPRPRHRKADPQAQAEFQAQLPQRLQQIAQAHPGRRLRVFFQDEARFGQQGTLTNVWAPKGSRPTAVRQTQYQYLWVLGAVCPETGRGEGLLSPRLNTEVVQIFLQQFSATLAPDEQAVMIWDGAGFHTSSTLQVPENISLLRLPPYSPELNPIENLWHYLKSHYWSNRAYADYEELEEAAMDAWRTAVLNPDLMRTVCNAPYLQRAVLK